MGVRVGLAVSIWKSSLWALGGMGGTVWCWFRTVVCAVWCGLVWKYLNYACRHLPFPKFFNCIHRHILCFLSHMHGLNPVWYPLVTIFSSVHKVLSVQNRTLPGLPCARWAYCYVVLWLLHCVTVCMPYLQCCVCMCTQCCVCSSLCTPCAMCPLRVFWAVCWLFW